MKKTIILIAAILLNAIILSAQDREPTAWEFNLDGTQKPFSANSYLQTKCSGDRYVFCFLLGNRK